MRRRRVIIILAACVLVGIGVVSFWPGEREPEYSGKMLSEWVQPYTWRYDDDEKTNHLITRERTAADEAIKHMGTNALHWLVRRIAYERPAWKTRIRRIVWKIPTKPVRYWCVREDQLRFAATETFGALGTNAAAAVPELAGVVRTSRSADARDAAMWALSYMGKDGFPVLLAALEKPDTKFRATQCICEMAQHGIDIGPAIPAFLLIDRETEQQAKKFEKANPGAIYHDPNTPLPVLFGLLNEDSAFLVPALINCLHHTNIDVRVEAAKTLGPLAEAARPAVPALKEALNDRETAVREAASTALQKIAPEGPTNAVKNL